MFYPWTTLRRVHRNLSQHVLQADVSAMCNAAPKCLTQCVKHCCMSPKLCMECGDEPDLYVCKYGGGGGCAEPEMACRMSLHLVPI